MKSNITINNKVIPSNLLPEIGLDSVLEWVDNHNSPLPYNNEPYIMSIILHRYRTAVFNFDKVSA